MMLWFSTWELFILSMTISFCMWTHETHLRQEEMSKWKHLLWSDDSRKNGPLWFLCPSVSTSPVFPGVLPADVQMFDGIMIIIISKTCDDAARRPRRSYPQLSVDLTLFADAVLRTRPFKSELFILRRHKRPIIGRHLLLYLFEMGLPCLQAS